MHTPDNTFRRHLLLGGLASVALVAAGCSKSAKPKGKTLPKEATLLCLGDSLTFGYGASAGAGYPQQLQQLTGYVTQNAGINGDTSEGALARLPALLQNNTPGLVLVSIGGNDFLRSLPLDGTRAALKNIVQTAAAGAQVVLIAQPKPVFLAAATGSLNDHEVYADVAKETGTPLFAGGWSYVLSRAELRSDQIHANDAGYKVFAERLAEWLRDNKFLG
ncbi:Lysophospholipase L1 [Polaromonas sp. YR568]|uniref:GDSL-type esterase/lipase family protein n=1 Tax=Polaromonas sp. YR568 TaxID=1855301 RepID=UPI0008ED8CAF|nr:GDSL-type esterase/lipase family protein [Polaromonas sp. YR568]SFU39269.1 Lysophospholipase L1 [Polaromonas sp. YR568]